MKTSARPPLWRIATSKPGLRQLQYMNEVTALQITADPIKQMSVPNTPDLNDRVRVVVEAPITSSALIII